MTQQNGKTKDRTVRSPAAADDGLREVTAAGTQRWDARTEDAMMGGAAPDGSGAGEDAAGSGAMPGFEQPGEELYALLPDLGRRVAEEEVPDELHRLAMTLGSRGGKA
ncbi:hypothetical protein ACFOGJ_14490 [Marinibaculum pumilum]|uniref:Anti-sigma factor NepR domain-containing protein n=1 Tax=Marinibaculum pumilum TaxID=1766165 RepID=A0ABV7L1V1_9PROT